MQLTELVNAPEAPAGTTFAIVLSLALERLLDLVDVRRWESQNGEVLFRRRTPGRGWHASPITTSDK